MVAGKADQGAAPCRSGPSFSPPRSCWCRSAPGLPTSSSGGRRLQPRGGPAVREMVAAFEQKTGKQVELVLLSQDECRERPWPRWRPGPAGLPVRHPISYYYPQWAHEDRLADLSDVLDPGGPVRSGRLDHSSCSTGQRAGAGSTRCRWGAPRTTSTSGRASSRGGLHPRGHPQGVGAVLVLLVRQGPAGGAPGHRPQRPLRRRPAMSVGSIDTEVGFRQFVAPTRPTM